MFQCKPLVWSGNRMLRRTMSVLGCLAGCFVVMAGTAHAAVALLMEEPYGAFGAMNPTGHAAVYLNHICADSPTALRPCHEGEYGVVISRYHNVHGYDWIAMPLVGYLYAVDEVSEIPAAVDRVKVASAAGRVSQGAPDGPGSGQ